MSDKTGSEFGKRVYTYKDEDGNEFFSFYKAPNVISPPRRLILQSRVGKHLVNFSVLLRQLGQRLQEGAGTVG